MNIKDDTLFRHYTGALLGACLGFIYGFVSQSINSILLPHVPLYQPPLGWIGNILLWSLIGALLGLVTALPAESIIGALYGGATGAFLLTILTLSSGGSDQANWTGKIIGVLFLFLPLAGAITPLTALLRWVVNKSVEGRRESIPTWARLRLPILLIILVGALGIFSRLPPYAQIMVTQMDWMLRVGLECTQESQLPEPLQQDRVGGFLSHASDHYRLEWQNRNINRFAIPRPMSNRPWEESVVIARFDNGWNLVCLYAKSDAQPACKGYQDDL